jgi:hypothetical protein
MRSTLCGFHFGWPLAYGLDADDQTMWVSGRAWVRISQIENQGTGFFRICHGIDVKRVKNPKERATKPAKCSRSRQAAK